MQNDFLLKFELKEENLLLVGFLDVFMSEFWKPLYK